jgi:hypothetical protein
MCTGPDRSRRVCLCSMSMFISADPLIKLILVAVAHTLPCEMVRPCPLSSSSVCLHGWVDGACVFCVIVVWFSDACVVCLCVRSWQVVDLRDEYQRIDTDCNGALSFPEFSGALGHARAVASGEVDLSIAYSAISIDRSHGHAEEMGYHEYIAAAMCRRIEIEETRIQAVFDMLDGGEF